VEAGAGTGAVFSSAGWEAAGKVAPFMFTKHAPDMIRATARFRAKMQSAKLREAEASLAWHTKRAGPVHTRNGKRFVLLIKLVESLNSVNACSTLPSAIELLLDGKLDQKRREIDATAILYVKISMDKIYTPIHLKQVRFFISAQIVVTKVFALAFTPPTA